MSDTHQIPKMHKVLFAGIEDYACNLSCPYCCNIAVLNSGYKPAFKYSPEFIGKALSAERLGGVCHIHLTAFGETLIRPEMIEVVRELLKQGHYIGILTNGTLTKRIKQLSELPLEMRERIFFKISFHYLEFIKKGILEQFFHNIDLKRTLYRIRKEIQDWRFGSGIGY